MPKTTYGPTRDRAPRAQKTTDYKLHNGMGKPGSNLTNIGVIEVTDYGNGIRVSLSFSRFTADSVLLELRDYITFIRGESATDIIKKLRGLAGRLEVNCVKNVEAAVRLEKKDG